MRQGSPQAGERDGRAVQVNRGFGRGRLDGARTVPLSSENCTIGNSPICSERGLTNQQVAVCPLLTKPPAWTRMGK